MVLRQTQVLAESVFKVLAEIGVVLLMFMARPRNRRENDAERGRSRFLGGNRRSRSSYAGRFAALSEIRFSWPEAIFIGTILTATSVTITAQTLMNLDQLRSRAGSTILGAAVIDDVLGLIVLSLVIALAPQLTHGGQASWGGLAITLGRMAICLVTILWLGPHLVRWTFKLTARMHGHHTEVAAALVLAFLLAFDAEWLGGMAAITGAYLAGLFIAGSPVRDKVAQDLHPMIHSFFGPLFFVSVGLEINARQLGGNLVFFFLLLAVAHCGQGSRCGVGARLNGFGNRDSLIVGAGMIPRGEVA